MPLDYTAARRTMVEQQVRPWDVLDPRVLATIGEVRREDFVGPRHRKLAYADIELPLEHGESMLKPIVEGRILQALDLAAFNRDLGLEPGPDVVVEIAAIDNA